jgi:formate hydrogenlyase transcriptional activator
MSVANVGLTPQTPFMTTLAPLRVDRHRMASEALDRLRAQSEIDAKNARLRLLFDLTKSMAAQLELNDLFKNVAAGVRGVIRSDFALAGLLDSETGQLHVHAFELPDHILLDQEARGILGVVLAERVFSSGKLWVGKTEEFSGVTTEDGRDDATEDDRKWAAAFKNVCALPLVSHDRMLGLLAVGRRDDNSYTHDEVDFLTQVSSLVALAIENAVVKGELQKLKESVTAESVSLENEIPSETQFEEIVGKSAALQRLLREVKVVAPTNSGILIQGETGTGKELIARAIHNMSVRRDRPFVKLNCAAIPSGLLESELFGHEKGAFTGAIMRKAGRFEVADKGTLFLDEVGDIPLEVQSKLLRVLQEQEFEKLGSTRTQQVDVRVIAATHRDLKQMVEEGKFRRDLFYRLHVFPLLVPPLRDRREDIPMLARHYVEKYARRMNRPIETIPSRAMEVFVNYSWPGNVRELQNFIERAVILSPGGTLRPPLDELLDELKEAGIPHPPSSGWRSPAKFTSLEEVEREHVLRAIRESNWIIGGPNGAAARLGMKRTTLTYRIRKLNISRRPL